MITKARKVFASILALQLIANIFITTTVGFADEVKITQNVNSINVFANEKRLSTTKIKSYKSEKGYLVPAKSFAKLLKVKYKYYKKTKLIVLKKKSKKMYLPINKKTAIFNKRNIKLKVKTRLISKEPMIDAISVAKRFKYKYSKFFSDTQCLVVATKKKYLKNPLPVSVPSTTRTPTPEVTVPTSPINVVFTATATNTLPTSTPTKTPMPTPTPGVSEDDIVYSNNFNNGLLGDEWNGFSLANDPTNPTNKVLSHTETNWNSKLSGNLLSNCDPNQTYTIQFKIYGDAAHVAISYGQPYELVTTKNNTDIKNGIVSMSEQYYPGLYVRPVANQWDTYIATFKGYSQYKLYIMTQCDNNVNGGTVLLDDIKIYKGDYFITPTPTVKPTVGTFASPSISIDPNGGKEGTSYAYRTTGLPICFINTNDNSDPVSKGVYKEGVMCIEETGASGTRLLNPLKIKIAVRGNSTSVAPKKPYNIKFLDNPDGTKNKQQVLGMSSHHKWNLLANYYDKSLLRNAVALKFASQLDGLDYTPDFRFCEVVLNGQYVGNYMITEKVEIAGNRVNIKKDNGEGVYGYIIENDNRSPDFQFDAGGQIFKMAFKDPDSDNLAKDADKSRLNYIKNDIEQTWKNIYASTTYNDVTKYIDIDSFIDYHIVQDFAMPVDGYFSSIEMYKNCEGDVKLHMGPVWDYDLAFGNSNPNDVSNLCFKFTIYLQPIFNIADCRTKRTQRWNSTVKAIANSMLTYLDETASYIKKSAELNNKRWPLTSDSYYSGAIVHNNNNEEVAYFRSQLQERVSFIDERFNSGWY